MRNIQCGERSGRANLRDWQQFHPSPPVFSQELEATLPIRGGRKEVDKLQLILHYAIFRISRRLA